MRADVGKVEEVQSTDDGLAVRAGACFVDLQGQPDSIFRFIIDSLCHASFTQKRLYIGRNLGNTTSF
jgi:hypothetical protein